MTEGDLFQTYARGPGGVGPDESTEREFGRRTIQPGVWSIFDISRPTILRPLTIAQSEILYHPVRKPDADTDAFRSVGPSDIYLHFPGRWYVKVFESSGAIALDVLYYAVAPGENNHTYIESGFAIPTHTQVTSINVLAAGAVLATTLLQENRYRKMLIVQNESATADIWIKYGYVGDAGVMSHTGTTPPVGALKLASNGVGVLVVCGDTLFRGWLFGWSSAVSPVLNILEGV